MLKLILWDATYFMFREWLAASLLLPFMLVLLSAGRKWPKFGWLSRNKRRWLIFWSCYGLLKELFLGAVGTITLIQGTDRLDVLGRSTEAVLNLIHLGYVVPEVVFAIFLGAILEGALECGWATLSWWILTRPGTDFEGTHVHFMLRRYLTALAASACALGMVNDLNFRRPVYRDDCLLPYGFPFTFVREGGFVGVTRFVWRGVFADCLFVLLLAAVLGFVWNRVSHLGRKHKLS